MTIDFEPDETEASVADALEALCRQYCPEDVARAGGEQFPTALWAALAEFGLFTMATDDGAGGVVELQAAGRVLGAAVAPGPLAHTLFAMQVLPEADRAKVAAGEAIVALSDPPLAPWADTAQIFLGTDGATAWRYERDGAVDLTPTLGGERWGRVSLRRAGDLGPAERASTVHDIFLASYLAAAARKLLHDASAYAGNRRQFGKTLSQFQGVTHPLAECAIRLRAASTLSRIAAFQADTDAPQARFTAACARMSAEAAALRTAYVCHQSYGAMGVTADGPVFYISRRIRQLASQNLGGAERLKAVEAAYRQPAAAPLQFAMQ